MYKKLIKKWYNWRVCKFLEKYLPQIELGEIVSIEYLDSILDNYCVKTTTGEYVVKFIEELGGLRLYSIILMDNHMDKKESISIQVWGYLKTKIIPVAISIDNINERQITNLITMETAIYEINVETRESIDALKRCRYPISMSECADFMKLVEVSNKYVKH